MGLFSTTYYLVQLSSNLWVVISEKELSKSPQQVKKVSISDSDRQRLQMEANRLNSERY